MICYRDRTWCVRSIDEQCSNYDCPRFLTEKDQQRADELKLDISWDDLYTEDCGAVLECVE